MLRGRKIGFLLVGLSFAWACCHVRGEDGPVVQVFNRDSGGSGNTVVPLWRVPIHVSVTATTGYDENVNTLNSNAEGSLFTGANITADYSFGTSRTRATLHSGTGFTYYPELSDNRYDPNIYLDLTVHHQSNLRLSVDTSLHAAYQAEPDFQNDLGLNRRGGNYFSAQGSLGATYQWLPRFSTVTNYSLATVWYDEAIGEAQNRVDHQIGQSFRFLFLPMTTLVTDLSFAFATYDMADRGSMTYSLLGGVDHTFLPSLQGTFRAGASFRDAEQIGAGDQHTVNPSVQASLTYAVTGKTSLSWNASYATEESNVATSPGSLSFRTGLVLTYAVTPRISSNLSFFYARTDNDASAIFIGGNPAFSEDALDFALSFNYALSSRFTANVGYDRSEVDSEIEFRSYSRNRYSGGLTLSF